MRSEKGITLMILIITIVVMIIISAVTVKASFNSKNGVYSETKNQIEYQNNATNYLNSSIDSTLQNQEKEWGL